MKYPFIYLLRDDKYSDIDAFIEDNMNALEFSAKIISPDDCGQLNNMFGSNHHILITYGGDEKQYSQIVSHVIPARMTSRWIHKTSITDIAEFNRNINYCYINNVIQSRVRTRPIFSIFTTCYNSYSKINRAYEGLKAQTMCDWEWVILDDSPDDKHFDFLREIFIKDKRIRLYKRDCNSGNIGNVKNEAVSLCRGKYVLELDHDDIVLPEVLQDACREFDEDKDVGFVYMDFINVYEDWTNFRYGDFLCKGYGGYIKQKYKDRWVDTYVTPNINNITLSHLICMPNHPRIWRRDTLMKLENYSEFLPICDDYEILLRTALNTKIVKVHKLGYVQFMNDNNSNFSLIRNAEINRIGPRHIMPQFFDMYSVNSHMKTLEAHEDEAYIHTHSKIWKRKEYKHKFCNRIVNRDYDKQYCLVGKDMLERNDIEFLYKDPRNDFVVLSNKETVDELTKLIDAKGFHRMKCYSLTDETDAEIVRYFHLICKHNDNFEIIGDKSSEQDVDNEVLVPATDIYPTRHNIINSKISQEMRYLEIGIEYGTTFTNIDAINKTGVDPDPKFEGENIIKNTSDEFFETNNDTFDVIFIDGMHQSEYVLRDFNNSIECLNDDGIIFIDDILPICEEEQLKIPTNPKYENGIMKYSQPWTGDVWKFIYHLLTCYSDKINIVVYSHRNYRGVAELLLSEVFTVPAEELSLIESYTYESDFSEYKRLLF